VRTGGLAEEDSLAENVHREALHPLDQFRAFQTLREKGLSEEDIAARFFVSATVVKQRLKLAAVSPKLLDIYAGDGMTLEQLIAFTVTNDHGRQEQVWEQLSHGCNTEPYYIRRQLTEGAVRATDKRAMFVGVEAYEAAGGIVTRDLFEHDDGGWLQDPALLDRLVIEKLKAAAEKLRTEGWKWISVAPDFPYGHTAGLRRLDGHVVDLTDEEIASRDALEAELAGPQVRLSECRGGPQDRESRSVGQPGITVCRPGWRGHSGSAGHRNTLRSARSGHRAGEPDRAAGCPPQSQYSADHHDPAWISGPCDCQPRPRTGAVSELR
jgi:ParB family chromosome partitioning protein